MRSLSFRTSAIGRTAPQEPSSPPSRRCLLDSITPPGPRSVVTLGSVPEAEKSIGRWRLAAIEKKELVLRLSRMGPPIDPNRCLLDSEDYSLQLAIRVPPLSGRVDFGPIWYPPGIPAPGVFRVSFVVSGKSGVELFESEFPWPSASGKDFLDFKPSVSLHALERINHFEIYAGPFLTP